MIHSMTGYGSAKGASGNMDISVELKSVNNRYLDCTIRLPRGYAAVEESLKNRVQKVVSRGKVEVYVTVDTSRANDVRIAVNGPLADAYVSAYSELAARAGLKNDLTVGALSRFPDVFTVEKRETDVEVVGKDMAAILDEALEDFNGMRLREGEKLHAALICCLDRITELTGEVEVRSPETVREYRARLEQRLRDVLSDRNVDETRLITEAAIFADRVAVSEETVRLHSHVSQFRTMLDSPDPVGKKCDFLIQEMNREANTIGSKCNDAEMAKLVVELKSEIEKLREQIQNVE